MNHPALVTIFDGGNIICQGYTPDETFEQYLAMKPSIGWMHIKDYRDPTPSRQADDAKATSTKTRSSTSCRPTSATAATNASSATSPK